MNSQQDAVESIHPLVHAVGGSLGSATALLLLYPLERARIEMQSRAAHVTPPTTAPVRSSSSSRRTLTGNESSQRETTGTAVVEQGDQEQRHDSPSPDSWTTTGSDPHGSDSRSLDSSEEAAAAAATAAASAPPPFSATPETNPQDLLACFRRLYETNELYRGVGPIVATLAASNFVFFLINECAKRVFLPTARSRRHRSAPGKSLAASCVAGVCTVLVTNPLWVANLKIVTGQAESARLWRELVQLARRDGIRQLYKGTGPSLLLVSNPVIQFFLYEQLKGRVLGRSGKNQTRLQPAQAFCLGAAAKAVSTVLTYPLQLTQAVLRLQQRSTNTGTSDSDSDCDCDNDRDDAVTPRPRRYSGTLDCLTQLYERDGAKGLYTGMKAKLLQTVLTAAFTFLTYEQILQAVHSAHVKLLVL